MTLLAQLIRYKSFKTHFIKHIRQDELGCAEFRSGLPPPPHRANGPPHPRAPHPRPPLHLHPRRSALPGGRTRRPPPLPRPAPLQPLRPRHLRPQACHGRPAAVRRLLLLRRRGPGAAKGAERRLLVAVVPAGNIFKDGDFPRTELGHRRVFEEDRGKFGHVRLFIYFFLLKLECFFNNHF